MNFVAAYERGETPNSCVFCNKRLKFEELYKLGEKAIQDRDPECRADAAPVIATGHYAVIEYDENASRYKLRKANISKRAKEIFEYISEG